jgi:hypothetical protein
MNAHAPRRILSRAVPAFLAAAILASGCLGLPAGSADSGDLVAIRYSAYDLETGALLRENHTAEFIVGSGASGLGSQVEGAMRGRLPGDSFTVSVRDDPDLDYSTTVEVNRTLAPIPIEQSAPRSEFEQFVGPATVGQTFPAYGIYNGVVHNVTDDTVHFRIEAVDGQQDPVPSVGALLITTMGTTNLQRTLNPDVGQTFTIAPPSPMQPSTPLGLQPGSYRVLGATEDTLQYRYVAAVQPDLIGKDLHVEVTVIGVTPAAELAPTGNFGERSSNEVNGDPPSVLGQPLPPSSDGHGNDDGHNHTH